MLKSQQPTDFRKLLHTIFKMAAHSCRGQADSIIHLLGNMTVLVFRFTTSRQLSPTLQHLYSYQDDPSPPNLQIKTLWTGVLLIGKKTVREVTGVFNISTPVLMSPCPPKLQLHTLWMGGESCSYH